MDDNSRHREEVDGGACPDPGHSARSATPSAGAATSDNPRNDAFTQINQRIDATGTKRRAQSLFSIGHTQEYLAHRMGYRHGRLPFLRPDRTRVYTSTAIKMRELYAELRDTPGPSKKNLARVGNYDWWTPTQWDLVNIDNPAVDPSAVLSRREQWKPLITAASYTEDGRLILCRTHPDPDLWHATLVADVRRATVICATCPVRRDCLRNALINGELWGVWGGLSANQRRRIRRALLHRLAGRPIEDSPELDDTLDTFAGPVTTKGAPEQVNVA